jgi:hypothetical protein
MLAVTLRAVVLVGAPVTGRAPATSMPELPSGDHPVVATAPAACAPVGVGTAWLA